MSEIIKRELVYLWYYFSILIQQIAPYWVFGILVGSIISVFAKDRIHSLFIKLKGDRFNIVGIAFSSILGILSPLCMYGTIPIAASFSKSGIKDDYLSAFMVSSILLNPQLIIYSSALGVKVLSIRIISCFLCGIIAGLLVKIFFRNRNFLNFDNFNSLENKDINPNIFMRLFENIYRNIKATGIYFLVGILLSSLFQRYVPAESFALLFAKNKGFGILLAASIGVPLYVCGGGTIPLLISWLQSGMSLGSAATFMITGPSTKITNLSALKSVLGIRNFVFYILYIFAFSLATGFIVDILF